MGPVVGVSGFVESYRLAARSNRWVMNATEIHHGTRATSAPTAKGKASPLVDVLEVSATKGEWTTPAVKKVSLALTLSNFSTRWRGSRGLRSENVCAGTMAICEFNHSQRFEM